MTTKEHNETTLTEDQGVRSSIASGAYESRRSDSTLQEAQKNETQTTNFNNDAEVVIAEVEKPKPLSRELLKSAVVSKVQDIKDFLAKPYPYVTGNLASTDTSSTFSEIQVPSSLLALDIYKQKLKGHLGFKGDLVFRLQINANRFQQGRYILYYLPGAFFGTPNYASYTIAKTYSLTQVTQLPHVEIDIACDTEAILKVPYTSWSTHWSILDQNAVTNTGLVRLRPYVPVSSSGGSVTADYTLWTYFENVEFVGPTLSQMDMKVKKKQKSPTEMEQDEGKLGPLGRLAAKIGRTADTMSRVPSLELFALPVSWAADIAAGVAYVWGWSNPIDLSNVNRMVQTIHPYANNVDAFDESMPLALYSRNQVETMESNGSTSIDEMSLNYIASIPAFYKQVTISTVDDYNTLLWSEDLTPSVFYQTFALSSGASRAYTPLGYLSTMFQSWRGSIGFKFKFVKTEFHSARFVLSFAPYQTTHATWNVTDTPYLFREIIDLRYGNEFTVVIPYTSLKPYRSLRSDQPYGKICLHVLNDLKAPASVSSTIEMLIEPFGYSDFEFAVPENQAGAPFLPNAVAQMDDGGVSDGNACSINETFIGGAFKNADTLAPAKYCIGEKLLSVLSLLKHSSNWQFTNGPVTQTSLSLVTRATNWVGTSGLGDPIAPSMKADLFSRIAPMYAYSRGSMRIKGVYDSDSIIYTHLDKVPSGSALIPPFESFSSNIYAYANHNRLGVFEDPSHRGGFEVQIPYYNEAHVSPAQWLLASSSFANSASIGTPDFTIPITRVIATTNAPSTAIIYQRQLGDDSQFFQFNGTPPLWNVDWIGPPG